MKDKSNKKYCDYLTNYTYLLWDGLGFFGFDDNKLERLKGKNPKWYDRFSNKRWVVSNLIIGFFVIYVLSGQVELLGDVKNQVLNREQKEKYWVNADLFNFLSTNIVTYRTFRLIL